MADTYSYMLDYLMQGEESRRQLEEQIRRMTEKPGFGVPFSPGIALEALGARQEGSITAPQLTPLGERLFGGGAPEEPAAPPAMAPSHHRADAGDTIREVTAAREAAEAAQMQDKAMQRSLDPMAWVGGAGPDSGKDFPSDKLWKIRAEAKAKGRAGSLSTGALPTEQDYTDTAMAGGGSFSQQEPSDVLTARLAERDEWLAGQPERDLQFAMTPEQKRRDPEYAADAAGKLAQLRAVKAEEQKLANQQLLIEKVAESAGGKVPFRLAGELALGGLPVPYELRGSNPDQIKVQLEDIQAKAMQDIQGSMMAGTPEFAVRYLHYVESAMAELTKRLDAGADPDQILDEARRIVMGGAIESGTMQFLEQSQQGQ